MLVHSTRHPQWLSNSWLIADKIGGDAILIDSGGPSSRIDNYLDDNNLTLRHVLCTHHHYDHVENNDHYRQKYCCEVCAHSNEVNLIDGAVSELIHNQILSCGGLEVRCLHIPGHTSGQLAFYVNGEVLFTGDTLFAGSIGGTQGPDHTSFEDLQHSLFEVLFALPDSTVVYPGHMQATTLSEELATNPFVRAFQGKDVVRERDCEVMGIAAKLMLRAADYDGGTKCWVRSTDGIDDIVAGSQVKS
jgi:hydroxyacylglutathione hydrolase